MHVAAHLVVRESQHAIALAFQPSLPLDIAQRDLRQSFMHPAVDLDDQIASVRRKVRKEPTDRGLAAKVRVKLPQFLP